MKPEWTTPRVFELLQPSKEDIQRWRRIVRSPQAYEFFHEVMRLSARVDPATAADIFEHLTAIFRRQIGKQRRGQRNPEEDGFLLACWDAARNGELPGQTKKWKLEQLAHELAENNRQRWGDDEQHIFERLRRLVNERKKKKKSAPR